ncbi:MAG: class I SAM-dependent methyltransferase [Oscillospiraceae bacterium]|nr:class I SAM-dependent methyltransferase [Oscillospiraceae bacterium]
MKVSDTGWSLDIKNHSWVEDTENQVDFIVKTLGLTGRERILDLGCGFGRHSLSLARRGYFVVGVDYTKVFIEDAQQSAKASGLAVEFICADALDLRYDSEFDAVLNLADGAIGFFEDDRDNVKVFDVIARALKPGGKHFMDVCNAEHAEQFFPKRHWEIGAKRLSLPDFDWDPVRRRMLFTDWGINFGEIAVRPEKIEKDTRGKRLYSKAELSAILQEQQMRIVQTFSNFYGKPDTPRELQLMVFSVKV